MQIAEFAVDGCEADIGDLVERLEPFHDHNADVTGGKLGVQGILHFRFNLGNERFHLFLGDRTLVARLHDTGQQLIAVEQLL